MPSPETDPSLFPAHILAPEIAARRLSPVDLVDALLARIEAKDGKLHAFVDVYARRGAARRRGGRQGDPIGPCDRPAARDPDRAQGSDRDRRAGHDRRFRGLA